MAISQAPFFIAALLLACSGLHYSSPSPACPQSCTCQSARLLNCSSGLSSVPQPIQDSFNELDLSHNLLSSVKLQRPHHRLRKLWLGNNSITHLSLCLDRKLERRYFRHRLRTWSRRGCLLWAPTLQLLSAERNLLGQLPEGLDGVRSLQVLQLSFNRISTLQPGELGHLQQLKELHLKQNLITHLHPRMFQSLVQLRVLDLSFNKMTSLHPSVYLTLRNIATDFRLNGNGWQCDCNMRSLRRRMIYDHSRGLQTWSIVCASPSTLYGRDLLQLEEEDLKCLSADKSPDLHQDVTVYSGSEILLSCSAEDSLWWTPNGPASVSQHPTDLLISDISERNTGLYVCVSEEQHIVSVFNLQISKVESERKERSLPRARRQIAPQDTPLGVYEEKNLKATSSNLALAVCLSIFFTFLIAFILGVLARPCIDVLWKRVTRKKTPSTTSSVTSDEPRQYDNEAFSSAEEPEEVVPRRERRVTFSTVDIIENSNIHYYDTVASGEQDSNRNESRQSTPEDEQSDDSGSAAGHTKDMQFERIPDPAELEERRLSSGSDSSLSEKDDQMVKAQQIVPRFQKLAENSLQQSSDSSAPGNVELQQISNESKSEILEFSSEPFTDWSPHTNKRNPTDINTSPDNGELFEFSDSAQSISPRPGSVISPFDNPKQIQAPTSDKQKRGDTSSSSSYISDNEPTEYTVNSDRETEQCEGFGLQLQDVDPVKPTVTFNQGDYAYNSQTPPVRPDYSFSSDSSDSDMEPKQSKSKQKKSRSRMVKAEKNDREEVKIMPPPVTYSSVSCSESEEETTIHKARHNEGNISQISTRFDVTAQTRADKAMDDMQKKGQEHVTRTQLQQSQSPSCDSSTQWPSIDLAYITGIKRRLDIKAPTPASDSSSCSATEDELYMSRLPIKVSQAVNHDLKNQWPAVDLGHKTRVKRRLDIKAPSLTSDSSSASQSEEEMEDQTRFQRPGKLDTGHFPFEDIKRENKDPNERWPVVDLHHIPHIKRRLDIKAPSPSSDSSSSSDSEDETTGYIHHQRPGKLDIERFPSQQPKTEKDPNGRWPVVDLHHIPHIKRRLDIKAPSPSSDSSSSSDSEDETTGYMKKQEQNKLHMSRLPVEVSQTKYRDPENQWPAVDLWQTIGIKRRLDIKAPSPSSDSSSSSDSEDETTGYIHHQRPGKLDIERFPSQERKRKDKDPNGRWPVVDLHHIPHVKRRLDVKAPSPSSDSSSSSDSEDETKGYMKKQEQNKLHMSRLPVEVSQTKYRDPENQWPAVDLWQTIGIKRRLDIKAPSPSSDSSSSSDSEDETTGYIHHQRPGKLDIERFPSQERKRKDKDPNGRWPVVDLHHIPHIKRRLDIKAPSPSSDSSSSSNSEDETTGYIHHQRPGKLDIERFPSQQPKTEKDPNGRWPVVDLHHIPHIKRRLDIKAPSPSSDSSSSSDSEDETTGYMKKQEQNKLHMSQVPVEVSQTKYRDPENQWPAVDLWQTLRIKRRLDIKAPSPSSDSSSSSDSEDETTGYIHHQRPGKLDIERFPSQQPKTEKDSNGRWPVVDLHHIPHIKRRLDVKAPSPSSDLSSSSDSEDETTGYMKKQEQNKLHMSRLPVEVSQTKYRDPENQWPAVDLWQTLRIKRRLDIKAPSPSSDSSSSSDSEDETTGYIHHQRPGKLDIERFPSQQPKTEKDSNGRWPVVDLHHIPHIKRRLDIKAPSPSSDLSSSSDSEDETTGYTKKQEQNKLHMSRLPVEVSQTKYRDPENQWPAVDLWQTIGIKRRLDIKAPSPSSDSSSSSDSEDETTGYIHYQRPGKLDIERFPSQEPKTEKDPNGRWPVVDLHHIPHIKRRLDVKAPSPSSDSSSSSDSEDGQSTHVQQTQKEQFHTSGSQIKVSQTKINGTENQWPAVNLQNVTKVKRRLDITMSAQPWDSVLSGGNTNNILDEMNEKAYKSTHSYSSSRTDEKEEGLKDKSNHHLTSELILNSKPELGLHRNLKLKRRLNIKVPSSKSSSSSDESDSRTTDITETVKGDKVHLGMMPYNNKREQSNVGLSKQLLGSRQSESYSSTSESEDENLDHKEKIVSEKKFITSSRAPRINISRSPQTNSNIKLEKYEIISDDLGNKPSDDTICTTEINPELQSRWATMNLGISRFRQRLEITSRTNETTKMQQSPTSDSTHPPSGESRSERITRLRRKVGGIRDAIHTDLSPVPENKPVNVSPTIGNSDDKSSTSTEFIQRETEKYNLLTNEGKPKLDTVLVDFGAPQVGRYVDITEEAPSKQSHQLAHSSSSSSSEDEMRNHYVLDLSLGVPQIKRRLNIKAPSPEPSSSSSNSENENDVTGYEAKQSTHASNISAVADDSSILYKRSIIKASSISSYSFSPSGWKSQTVDVKKQKGSGDRNGSLSSVGFDDIVRRRVKQSRSDTDVDLPHEIKWTGVGHHTPDLPISQTSSETLISLQQSGSAPLYSSSNLSVKMMQDNEKTVTLSHEYSSFAPKGVPPSTNDNLDRPGSLPGRTYETSWVVSEDRRERRGLNALKAMSLEMRKWDTDLDKNATPSFDEHGPQGVAHVGYSTHPADTQVLSEQPSPKPHEKRILDLLYGVPRYRRHDIKQTEPQEAPPPDPATPPPDY